MESNNVRSFSEQGIQEIANALGINVNATNDSFAGEFDEESNQLSPDFEGTDGGVVYGGEFIGSITPPAVFSPRLATTTTVASPSLFTSSNQTTTYTNNFQNNVPITSMTSMVGGAVDNANINPAGPSNSSTQFSPSTNTVWPIYVVSQTIKTAADGTKTVDCVIEFESLPGVETYRYRIVPV